MHVDYNRKAKRCISGIVPYIDVCTSVQNDVDEWRVFAIAGRSVKRCLTIVISFVNTGPAIRGGQKLDKRCAASVLAGCVVSRLTFAVKYIKLSFVLK